MKTKNLRKLTPYDTCIYFVPDTKPLQKRNEQLNNLNNQLSKVQKQLNNLNNQVNAAHNQFNEINNQVVSLQKQSALVSSRRIKGVLLLLLAVLQTGVLVVWHLSNRYLALFHVESALVMALYIIIFFVILYLARKPQKNGKRYAFFALWFFLFFIYTYTFSHSTNGSTIDFYLYVCLAFHLFPVYAGVKLIYYNVKSVRERLVRVSAKQSEAQQKQNHFNALKNEQRQKRNQVEQIKAQINQVQQAKIQQTPAPTDQEFDSWLESRVNEGLMNTIRKLGLEDEISSPKRLLRIRGYVLPGMKEAHHYRAQDLHSKLGADGRRRYSINLYTYFFPAEHRLVVFTYDINAMNWNDYRETTRECFYQDVTRATTEDSYDTLMIDNNPQHYRTQRFSLGLCDGTAISATVRSYPLDDVANLPVFDIPQTNIDGTIAQLRMLLRTKKS